MANRRPCFDEETKIGCLKLPLRGVLLGREAYLRMHAEVSAGDKAVTSE